LRTALDVALSEGHALPACEVLLRLTDDAELQQLNARFRSKDEPTDVLSFATELLKDGRFTGRTPSAPFHLGEIYISMPTCIRQAREYKHAVDDELTLLTIHGALHLLGFDHIKPAQKRSMWQAQARAFAQLGRSNPLDRPERPQYIERSCRRIPKA
jgi:probable rRNA maturation factor